MNNSPGLHTGKTRIFEKYSTQRRRATEKFSQRKRLQPEGDGRELLRISGSGRPLSPAHLIHCSPALRCNAAAAMHRRTLVLPDPLRSLLPVANCLRVFHLLIPCSPLQRGGRLSLVHSARPLAGLASRFARRSWRCVSRNRMNCPMLWSRKSRNTKGLSTSSLSCAGEAPGERPKRAVQQKWPERRKPG